MKTTVLSAMAVAMLFCAGCVSPAIRTNLCVWQPPDVAPGNPTATVIVGESLSKYGEPEGADRSLIQMDFFGLLDHDALFGFGDVKLKKIDGVDISSLIEAREKETNLPPPQKSLFRFYKFTIIDIPAGVHELSVFATGSIKYPGRTRADGWEPAPYTFTHDFQANRTYFILANKWDYQQKPGIGFVWESSWLQSITLRWYLTEKLPLGYTTALQQRRTTGNNMYYPKNSKEIHLNVCEKDCVLLGTQTYDQAGSLPIDVMEGK